MSSAVQRIWKGSVSWVESKIGLPMVAFVAFVFFYVVLNELYRNEITKWLSPVLDRTDVDFLSIALALLALFYALKHHQGLANQTKELKRQVEHMSALNNYLSTKRTGPFPEYLSQISMLAAEADCFDVLVDCLDFGSFFDPSIHQEVHDAICKARARHCEVRILICADVPEPFTGPSGQELQSQPLLDKYCRALQEDKGFVDWLGRSSKNNSSDFDRFSSSWLMVKGKNEAVARKIALKDYFDACINACLKPGNLKVKDADAVTTLLQLRQFWFATKLQQANVQIRGLGKSEPLFFWVKYARGSEGDPAPDDARFTFANAARGPKQLGFETHDPDLLNVFEMIFTEKWKESEKIAETVGEPAWLSYLRNNGTLS